MIQALIPGVKIRGGTLTFLLSREKVPEARVKLVSRNFSGKHSRW